jgi:hypothetical protein
MREKRIKFTPHSEETIARLLEMHDAGMRSKDIYKQSKEIFGYRIQQSTISNILSRNGRNAKENTYRVKRHYHPPKKKEFGEITPYNSPIDVNETPTTYKSPIDLKEYSIEDYPRPEGVSAASQLTIDLKRKTLAKKNGQPLYNDYIPKNSDSSVENSELDDSEDFENEDDESENEESEEDSEE